MKTINKYFPEVNGESITALNVAILTAAGSFRMVPVTVEDAKKIWHETDERLRFSAVGHEATAKVMSSLLGDDIPVNRVNHIQKPGTVALVLKMRSRIPEGTVLTDVIQLEEIGYDFFLLYMEMGHEKKPGKVLLCVEEHFRYCGPQQRTVNEFPSIEEGKIWIGNNLADFEPQGDGHGTYFVFLPFGEYTQKDGEYFVDPSAIDIEFSEDGETWNLEPF